MKRIQFQTVPDCSVRAGEVKEERGADMIEGLEVDLGLEAGAHNDARWVSSSSIQPTTAGQQLQVAPNGSAHATSSWLSQAHCALPQLQAPALGPHPVQSSQIPNIPTAQTQTCFVVPRLFLSANATLASPELQNQHATAQLWAAIGSIPCTLELVYLPAFSRYVGGSACGLAVLNLYS